MEALPGDWAALLWPLPLLMFGFWLMFTGRLVSGRQVDRMMAIKDDLIAAERAEKMSWRQAHSISEETRGKALEQVQTQTITSELAVRLLASLPTSGAEKEGAA